MNTLTPPRDTTLGLKKFDCKKLWLSLDGAADSAFAQRDVLTRLSLELIEMAEQLLIEIEVNRERARGLLAEFAGLFENAADASSILLDFDELFGGTSARKPREAVLAKQLEKSLCYLTGVLSAVHISDELSFLDWVNLKSDIDSVWKICRSIVTSTDQCAGNLKLAA